MIIPKKKDNDVTFNVDLIKNKRQQQKDGNDNNENDDDNKKEHLCYCHRHRIVLLELILPPNIAMTLGQNGNLEIEIHTRSIMDTKN